MNERSRAPDSASDRALAVATVIGCALTLCVMFWPAALRRVFVYGDLGSFLLPMRIHLAQSLERGITPLWMPNLFCGYYAHGEGSIGIFHPLRWLIYRFLPVSEAYNLECLIPYPFALVGMALFLRRLALPASAALFGGLSFAFCPYLTVRLTHVNSVTVIAHLGWLLLAMDVVLRESGPARRRAWLGLALVTGSQLLIGYPIAIAYCWLLAIPYTLFVAGNRREVWPALAVAAGIGAGVLLGGIQLVPTWDYWTTSERVAPSWEFLTDQSLNPWNLLIAIAPWLLRGRLYVDGEFNPVEQVLYFGPVVPIAASWVLLRWRELGRFRPLVAGLLALSALAFVLALGKHTGLYRWFVALPLVGLLRVPARYSIVLYFTGALLAAIAFAELQRGDPSLGRRRIWSIWIVPAASWLVAAIALAFGERIADYPARIASELAPLHLVVLGPLALTFAAALFTAAVRGRRAALFGLVALALADHAAYGATLWWYDPPQSLADYHARIERPPALPGERVATWKTFRIFGARVWRWSYWASTSFIIHDVRLVTGYVGLQPAKRIDYTKPVSLRLAGATTNLARFRLEHTLGTPSRLRVVNVYERLPGALPRARLVARAMRSAQPAIDLERIDVENTALVDEPLDLEAGRAGAAAIQKDEPGAIRIAVDAPTRQLLVLAESFHPGWRVAVDGAPARALRVNGDFLGVIVAAGAQVVDLRFAPRSFTVGCWSTVAGLAVVLAVALAGLIRAP